MAVEDQVIANGATVVLDGPGGVVLAYRPPVAHVFHAVMTLVDDWGNVWARSVAFA